MHFGAAQLRRMIVVMKCLAIIGVALLTLTSFAQTTPDGVWTALKESRSRLPGVHQEFEYSVSFKTRTATQAIKQTRIIDMSQGLWREASLGGGGDHIRIFDGTDILTMEEGGNEFLRVKRNRKDPPSMPAPYAFSEIDWKRAKELARQPCGFVENDHPCVVLQLPLKTTSQVESGRAVTVDASAVVKLDITTGLLILSRIQESVANPNGPYLDEERRVVEQFLKDNVKTYPVVLTTENEMPRPYQISVFPTYLVIDQTGNVASAAQGDKGFGELRNLLRKAGMDTE